MVFNGRDCEAISHEISTNFHFYFLSLFFFCAAVSKTFQFNALSLRDYINEITSLLPQFKRLRAIATLLFFFSSCRCSSVRREKWLAIRWMARLLPRTLDELKLIIANYKYLIKLRIFYTSKKPFRCISAPNFISSFTQDDFVYFFFRETAVEYINCGKVSFFFLFSFSFWFAVFISHSFRFCCLHWKCIHMKHRLYVCIWYEGYDVFYLKNRYRYIQWKVSHRIY